MCVVCIFRTWFYVFSTFRVYVSSDLWKVSRRLHLFQNISNLSASLHIAVYIFSEHTHAQVNRNCVWCWFTSMCVQKSSLSAFKWNLCSFGRKQTEYKFWWQRCTHKYVHRHMLINICTDYIYVYVYARVWYIWIAMYALGRNLHILFKYASRLFIWGQWINSALHLALLRIQLLSYFIELCTINYRSSLFAFCVQEFKSNVNLLFFI